MAGLRPYQRVTVLALSPCHVRCQIVSGSHDVRYREHYGLLRQRVTPLLRSEMFTLKRRCSDIGNCLRRKRSP